MFASFASKPKTNSHEHEARLSTITAWSSLATYQFQQELTISSELSATYSLLSLDSLLSISLISSVYIPVRNLCSSSDSHIPPSNFQRQLHMDNRPFPSVLLNNRTFFHTIFIIQNQR